jgi:plasmid replication initiation protein
LKSLRLRSFEWDNGLDRAHEDYEWLKLGLLTGQNKKKGVAEVQISNVLMPFLELSSQFTTYSLSVAMSLKSKWSQRMYELCQSGKEQMV